METGENEELLERQAHLDTLSRANEHFEKEEFDDAEDLYRSLLEMDILPATQGKALYNLGLSLKRRERYDEAISVFRVLIHSNIDDKEAGGNVMEAYRNYRHKACLQISSCYEAKADFANAFKYAKLARDEYQYYSWCGTCYFDSLELLEKRIEELEGKVRRSHRGQ